MWEYMFCINLSQVWRKFSIRSPLDSEREQYQQQDIKIFLQKASTKVYQSISKYKCFNKLYMSKATVYESYLGLGECRFCP